MKGGGEYALEKPLNTTIFSFFFATTPKTEDLLGGHNTS